MYKLIFPGRYKGIINHGVAVENTGNLTEFKGVYRYFKRGIDLIYWRGGADLSEKNLVSRSNDLFLCLLHPYISNSFHK